MQMDAHGCKWMHMDAYGCKWMHMTLLFVDSSDVSLESSHLETSWTAAVGVEHS